LLTRYYEYCNILVKYGKKEYSSDEAKLAERPFLFPNWPHEYPAATKNLNARRIWEKLRQLKQN
jgi:hypothetical protein